MGISEGSSDSSQNSSPRSQNSSNFGLAKYKKTSNHKEDTSEELIKKMNKEEKNLDEFFSQKNLKKTSFDTNANDGKNDRNSLVIVPEKLADKVSCPIPNSKRNQLQDLQDLNLR